MVDAPLQPASLEERASSPRPLLGYCLVLGAVCLWSLNATVAKVVIDSAGLTPMRLSELRAAGAGVLLIGALAVLRPGSLRVSGRELAFIAAFGVFGLASVQFFYFAAIERLQIGTALVIEYLAPVLVAAWARFYLRESVRRRLWIALALALAGLSLVVELWSGFMLDGLGVAAALAGALAYAVYILMADRSLKGGRDAPSLLALGFLAAALFWSLVQPWWTFPEGAIGADASLLGRLEELSAPVWLLVAFIVVLGTVVPFVMLINALHHLSPTRVVIVAMAEPVLAAVVAFAWLGERLSGLQIAGGALVLAAVAFAQTARRFPEDV